MHRCANVHAIALLGLALVLPQSACGADRASASAETVCRMVPARALHEHALGRDPTLVATPRDRVLLHLEPLAAADTGARDTGEIGFDAIPYALDANATVLIGADRDWVERVEIVGPGGDIVATIAGAPPDAPPTSVMIPAGPAGDGRVVLRVFPARAEAGVVPVAARCPDLGANDGTRRAPALSATTTSLYVGPQPNQSAIIPVATSVAAFVGWAPTGPIATPVHLTRFDDFAAAFGPLATQSHLGWSVWQFFANGGLEAYAVRVESAGAAPTALELVGVATAASGVHALDATYRAGPGTSNLVNTLVLPDLVALPGAEIATLLEGLGQYASEQNLLLLIDPPGDMLTPETLLPWAESVQSGRAVHDVALYAPRVTVQLGELGAASVVTGPSGTVAGVFAQSDAAAGVWSEPSGLHATTRGLTGVAYAVATTALAGWAESGVNLVRAAPPSGIILQSARTLGLTAADDHVGERRLVAYVLSSLRAGLAWVGEEPASTALCTHVSPEVTAFLAWLWQEGGLGGSTQGKAFTALCDATSTPGHVVVMVSLTLPSGAKTGLTVDLATVP